MFVCNWLLYLIYVNLGEIIINIKYGIAFLALHYIIYVAV